MIDSFEEDAIGRLIREEGLLTTSPGFTDRVMQLVEKNASKKGIAFKPLISFNMWMFITLVVVFLLLASIWVSVRENTGQSTYLDNILSFLDRLSLPAFPAGIDMGMVMLVTFILSIISLLLLLDLFLNKRLHRLQ